MVNFATHFLEGILIGFVLIGAYTIFTKLIGKFFAFGERGDSDNMTEDVVNTLNANSSLNLLTHEICDIMDENESNLLPIRDYDIKAQGCTIDCIERNEDGSLHYYSGFAEETTFDFSLEDEWVEIIPTTEEQIAILTEVMEYEG